MSAFLELSKDYAEALLIALLPAISDAAWQTGVECPNPITTNQVERFVAHRLPGHCGGLIVLTNGAQFVFDYGHVRSYAGTNSYTRLQEPAHIPSYIQPNRLDRSGAIRLARETFRRLGYDPAAAFAWPDPEVEGPYEVQGGTVPHYLVKWIDPRRGGTVLEAEINGFKKRVEQWSVVTRQFEKPAPRLAGEAGRQQKLLADRATQMARPGTLVPDEVKRLELQAVSWASRVGFERPLVTSDTLAQVEFFPTLSQTRVRLVAGEYLVLDADKQLSGYYSRSAFFVREMTNGLSFYLGFPKFHDHAAQGLARRALDKLGVDAARFQLDQVPTVTLPFGPAKDRIPRALVSWTRSAGGVVQTHASVEVDTATGQITALTVFPASLGR
jgi:hypothetical protein